MNIRSTQPTSREQLSAPKKRQDKEFDRHDLQRGVSNILLASTDTLFSSDYYYHPPQVLPSNQAAQRALTSSESEDLPGMIGELEQAGERADKQWALSMFMPLGALVGFAAVLGALPLVAGLSGAAALGVAGVGALVKSNQDGYEASRAIKGLNEAKLWSERDDLPPPAPRDVVQENLQKDIEFQAGRGDLTRVWRLQRLKSKIYDVEGKDGLELLSNLKGEDQISTVMWMRSRSESRPPDQTIPAETPLSEVSSKVEKAIARHLGKNDFLAAKKSLATLSLLEDSKADTWSELVYALAEKHDFAIRWNQTGDLGALFGPQHVRRVQEHLTDAVTAALLDEEPIAGKPKSRAEARKMLEDANEVPILADFPKENKARRAFKKLPGADLLEMVSHKGSKNRKRAQVLMQALHDSQLEWVIGTD